MTFLYPVTIREAHLDTFGHVNHATYLQLFEEARWELVTLNGYGIDRVHQTQQAPVILELNIRYQKEVKPRTQVVIETTLKEYEGRIGTILHRLVLPTGESACEATVRFGLFDLKSRKLIAPTPEWLLAITKLPSS